MLQSLYENDITANESWKADIVPIYRITSEKCLEVWAGQMSARHI